MEAAQDKSPIIVLWDYSDKAEHALSHAVRCALPHGMDIILAHITETGLDNAIHVERLNLVAENVMARSGIRPRVIVRTGNIFTEIKAAVEETGAALAIMGTHGPKGLQKFTGSWALKMIAGCKAPVLVVHGKPWESETIKIVMPLELDSQDRRKLEWVRFLTAVSRCKLYITYISSSDPSMMKRAQAAMHSAAKYLEAEKIHYELQRLDADEDLASASIDFASSIEASLIITTAAKAMRFQDLVLGTAGQKFIDNDAKIPVLCVNPEE